MTALVGFPLGTIYSITNITQSNPGVVTLLTVADPNSFAVADGMTVTFRGVQGMININDKRYVIGNFDPIAQTFQIYTNLGVAQDTTYFRPYTSGGQINIISYAPLAGQPPGLMFNNQNGY